MAGAINILSVRWTQGTLEGTGRTDYAGSLLHGLDSQTKRM